MISVDLWSDGISIPTMSYWRKRWKMCARMPSKLRASWRAAIARPCAIYPRAAAPSYGETRLQECRGLPQNDQDYPGIYAERAQGSFTRISERQFDSERFYRASEKRLDGRENDFKHALAGFQLDWPEKVTEEVRHRLNDWNPDLLARWKSDL